MVIDPITITTAVSAGLKLVDQFYTLVRRWRNEKEVTPHVLSAEMVADDKIEFKDDEGVTAIQIETADIKLDEWDETRYSALERRVKINWNLFNELYVQEAGLGPEESARIHVRMERIKEDLCTDFREMVHIYEHALGISLPDHYQLFRVC